MMFGNIVSNLKDLAQGIVAIPELADTAKEIDVMVKNVNSPLLIMVMGEFSTGKSSFINALVEKEVAIVDAKPTTAVITKLCYGLEDRITVYFLDGSQKDYNTEEFVSLTVEDESTTELRKNIDYVERAMPIEMLKSMTIIDSPGLNSLEKSHEGTTRQFMDRADTVVWLFDAHDSCKQTEIDAMKRLNPRLSPLVLVNKMDLIDEDEGDSPEKILSDVSRKLRNNRLEVQDIIGISAKLAFQGKQNNNEKFLSESNMEEFYQKVETVILPHRDTYKQNAMFDDLAKILFGAGTILSNKKSENDKQRDTDYGTYIETEETLAVVADALENVADAFLEFFDLSRSNFSDDQVNKKKLNASERTVFGTLYWLGLIIEKNAEVAQKHLEAAAVRNDEVAQRILMEICVALGKDAKARYWKERLGISDAISSEKEKTVSSQIVTAVMEDSHKNAMELQEQSQSDILSIRLDIGINQVLCYRENTEKLVPYEEAFAYFKDKAESGNIEAMYNLGVFYERGLHKMTEFAKNSPLVALMISAVTNSPNIIHPMNKTEAIKWYKKAVDSGFDKARERLDILLSSRNEEKDS